MNARILISGLLLITLNTFGQERKSGLSFYAGVNYPFQRTTQNGKKLTLGNFKQGLSYSIGTEYEFKFKKKTIGFSYSLGFENLNQKVYSFPAANEIHGTNNYFYLVNQPAVNFYLPGRFRIGLGFSNHLLLGSKFSSSPTIGEQNPDRYFNSIGLNLSKRIKKVTVDLHFSRALTPFDHAFTTGINNQTFDFKFYADKIGLKVKYHL